MEVMRFADELVDATEFSFPEGAAVRPQELQMAEQLVQNLSQAFDPSKYTDDYRDNLMKIIRAKMKGKKVETPDVEEPERTPVVDLMARLQESLELGWRASGAGGTKAAAKKPREHRAAKRRRSA